MATLVDAVIAQNVDLVRQILATGVHPDSIRSDHGNTPLMFAAQDYYPGVPNSARKGQIIQLLLAAGANPNYPRPGTGIAAYLGEVHPEAYLSPALRTQFRQLQTRRTVENNMNFTFKRKEGGHRRTRRYSKRRQSRNKYYA
jgi:hypothetical protein